MIRRHRGGWAFERASLRWARTCAGRRRRGWTACVLVLVLVALGCAPTQVVSITIQPVPVSLYIDGELHPEGAPVALELRADQPHLLFFKKEGYVAEQIVLHSVPNENGPHLEPDRVEVRLSPVTPKRRELKVELDE